MHPILVTFGPLTFYTYGVMMVVAFLTTAWLSGYSARQLPADVRAITDEQLVDFTSLALVGGILGGRVFYVLLHLDYFAEAPLEAIAIWHGGLVWYGGFLGGLIAVWLYVRAKRLVFLRVLDQFIPFLALGHAIGRVGCFFNGCCYGKPTNSWCGVLFPGHTERVIPTQLFEATGLCLLYILLRVFQKPPLLRRTGTLFGLYLIGYGLLRFAIERFRGDQTIVWAGLTLQQIISIGLLAAGAILVGHARWRTPTDL